MFGRMGNEAQQGMIPRAVKLLFSTVENKKRQDWTFAVDVSGGGRIGEDREVVMVMLFGSHKCVFAHARALLCKILNYVCTCARVCMCNTCVCAKIFIFNTNGFEPLTLSV